MAPQQQNAYDPFLRHAHPLNVSPSQYTSFLGKSKGHIVLLFMIFS